ncbi:DUF1499 domain-containing protein [Azoarcus taiwanensis]|uniref:DUF1499 domain-containing protein n=1 Tax=Azoarcus taiwanensis TaxID=666964 RepID=A0A972F897_9RHOO|nr:DUF1499 domain-containing protein [Azoarcus taiwanensis]NMG01664.1 DUF1499 domain-containing protein [Azoarcus taiwanensis]
MKLPTIAFAGSLLTVVLIAGAAFGTRGELWNFATGFQLLALGLCIGLFVLMVVVGTLISAKHRAQRPTSMIAFVIVIAALALPIQGLIQASKVPTIHDISTDLADPPQFVAAAQLRTATENPVSHAGEPVAALQRESYPDIVPSYLPVGPEAAFERALAAARAMDWEITANDLQAGHIEAVDTSFWFGFKDDVVIRIRADGPVSRIDVRSKSRVGSNDLGVNAQRIRDYKAKLKG